MQRGVELHAGRTAGAPRQRLDRARSDRQPTGPVDRYVSELQRHSIESVERELRWLTDLITAEHQQQTPHHPQPEHRSTPELDA